MDRQEFGTVVKALKAAYSNPNFLATRDQLGVWYDSLKGVDVRGAFEAVRRHVAESKYPPTIADIIRHTNDVAEEDRIERKRITDCYAAILYADKPEEAEAVFFERVYSLPKEKRLRGAQYLQRKANDSVGGDKSLVEVLSE